MGLILNTYKAIVVAVQQALGYDSYWNNVVLAMHCDGVDLGSVLTDEKGHSVTAVGNARTSVSNKKYGTSSLLLADAGSYATVANSIDWDMTAGAATLEMFVYIPTANTQVLLGQSLVSADGNWMLYVYADGRIGFGKNGINEYTSPLGTFQFAQWVHIAVVKNASGVFDMYYNGTLVATSSVVSFNASTNPIVIGCAYGTFNVPGTILDDIRITKGIARYTANFIPPASPFPNAASTDTYWSNVRALFHFDGANGSTTFADYSGLSTAVAIGSAALSTLQSKFGGSSLKGIVHAQCPSLGQLMLGDFTAEFFCYTNALGVFHLLDFLGANNLYAYTYNRGAIVWELNFSGVVGSSSVVPLLNTWQHIAIVRSGTNVKMYVDGTSVISITIANDANQYSDISIGGYYPAPGSYDLNGYIDEVRITKGVARYLANFVPPTQAFA